MCALCNDGVDYKKTWRKHCLTRHASYSVEEMLGKQVVGPKPLPRPYPYTAIVFKRGRHGQQSKFHCFSHDELSRPKGEIAAAATKYVNNDADDSAEDVIAANQQELLFELREAVEAYTASKEAPHPTEPLVLNVGIKELCPLFSGHPTRNNEEPVQRSLDDHDALDVTH